MFYRVRMKFSITSGNGRNATVVTYSAVANALVESKLLIGRICCKSENYDLI